MCCHNPKNDVESTVNGNSMDDSGSVMDVASECESETKPEEVVLEPDLATCDLCGQPPCDWEVFGRNAPL
jgi:hypothetical protein